MTDEGMVVVKQETTQANADIVVGYLRSEGIEALAVSDDAGEMLPSLDEALGVKILVRSEDAGRARRLLEERERDNSEE